MIYTYLYFKFGKEKPYDCPSVTYLTCRNLKF